MSDAWELDGYIRLSQHAGTEPSRLYRSRDGEHWAALAALQDIPSRDEWSLPPRPWTSHVRGIARSASRRAAAGRHRARRADVLGRWRHEFQRSPASLVRARAPGK
jgi:hypothetical protein